MIDDWFSAIELPITIEQFHQLPQNPAYKYEYFDGRAWLSPRPKSGRVALDLSTFTRPIAEIVSRNEVTIRAFREADWEQLPRLFSAAFFRVQPFASLSDESCEQAAEDCLRHTRQEGDGPLIENACFVAVSVDEDRPRGAILITVPDNNRGNGADGRPHITWIFVSPRCVREGIGMALLDAAVQELRRAGHAELRSSFLVGNESSTHWHWRAGFKLLEQPWSLRTAQQEARQEKAAEADAEAEP